MESNNGFGQRHHQRYQLLVAEDGSVGYTNVSIPINEYGIVEYIKNEYGARAEDFTQVAEHGTTTAIVDGRTIRAWPVANYGPDVPYMA